MPSEINELVFHPAQISAIFIYKFGYKEEFNLKTIRKLFGPFLTKQALDEALASYVSNNLEPLQIQIEVPIVKKVNNIARINIIGELYHKSSPPLSLQELGTMFNLSRERIRQIVVKYDSINNIVSKRNNICITKYDNACKNIDASFIELNKEYKSIAELSTILGIDIKVLKKWSRINKVKLHKINMGPCLKCGKLLWQHGVYCNDCNHDSRMLRIKEWSRTDKAKISRAIYSAKDSTKERITIWKANRNAHTERYVYCPFCNLPYPYDGTCNNGLMKHINRMHTKEEYLDIFKKIKDNSIVFREYTL